MSLPCRAFVAGVLVHHASWLAALILLQPSTWLGLFAAQGVALLATGVLAAAWTRLPRRACPRVSP